MLSNLQISGGYLRISERFFPVVSLVSDSSNFRDQNHPADQIQRTLATLAEAIEPESIAVPFRFDCFELLAI